MTITQPIAQASAHKPKNAPVPRLSYVQPKKDPVSKSEMLGTVTWISA